MGLFKNIYFGILSAFILKKSPAQFFFNLSFKFSSHFQLSFFFAL